MVRAVFKWRGALLTCSLAASLLAGAGCDSKDSGDEDSGVEYYDQDGDGFGSSEDCDDSDSSVHPGATELCDGLDNDCDGSVDEGGQDGLIWYQDADGDGFGIGESAIMSCDQPAGYVATDGDCNDADPERNPDADELCDGLDNDCDDEIDELGAVDGLEVWPDDDGDGWGDAEQDGILCCEIPEGYVDNGLDCDDSDDLLTPEDLDGDGLAGCNGDCDDADPARDAGPERWDLTDNDCDGEPEWLLVPDPDAATLEVLRQDGSLLDVLDTSKHCAAPVAVTRDGRTRAWVLCKDQPTLLRVDADRSLSAVSLGGTCATPRGVAWDGAGGLWVTCDEGLLFSLDAEGAGIAYWVLDGAPGQPLPDRRGGIWVADRDGGQVWRADGEAEPLAYGASHGGLGLAALAPDGTLWLPDPDGDRICRVGADGVDLGCHATALSAPQAVVFDRTAWARIIHPGAVTTLQIHSLEEGETWEGGLKAADSGGLSLTGTLWVHDASSGQLVGFSEEGAADVVAKTGVSAEIRGDFAGYAAWRRGLPGAQGQEVSVLGTLISESSLRVRAVGDLDADGLDDLFTSSGTHGAICFWSGAERASWAMGGPHTCWGTSTTHYAYTGDLDGDGLDDLFIPDTGMEVAYIFWGGHQPVGGWADVSGEADLALGLANPDSVVFHNPGTYADLGDVDGDGADDLLLGTTMQSGYQDQGQLVWFLWGRSRADWGSLNGQDLLAGADVELTGAASGFGREVRIVPDRDGDGLGELVVGAAHEVAEDGLERGAAYLFPGAAVLDAARGEILDDGDATIMWLDQGYDDGGSSGWSGGVYSPRWTGDADGDGLGDLVLLGSSPGFMHPDEGGAALVWGDVDLGKGGAIDDLVTVFAGGMQDRILGAVTVGDLDGDGHQDLALSAEGGDVGAGLVAIDWGGPLRRTAPGSLLSLEDAPTTLVASDESRLGTEIILAGDFDGDGTDELVVATDERLYVVGW